MRYYHELDTKVSEMMTKRDNLVYIKQDASFSQRDYFVKAQPLMVRGRKDHLLVIEEQDGHYNLRGLITFQDVDKRRRYKNACLIDQKWLMCGGAVGCNLDIKNSENDMARAEALKAVGVDYFVIDSSHGHAQGVINMVGALRNSSIVGKIQRMAGNICTGEAAEDLIKSGAHSLKVGVGPGSICTTRKKTGAGIPQVSSTYNVAVVANKYNVPVITDGGFKYPGDVAKALAAGASAAMTGKLFAGADETPGEIIRENGVDFKSYRGMGTLEAMMKGSADRYEALKALEDLGVADPWDVQPLEQGVPKRVPCSGPIYKHILEIVNGVKYGMGMSATQTIAELRDITKLTDHLVKVTAAGLGEGA